MKKNVDYIRDKIIPILEKYPIRKASIFGSILHKPFGKAGDIDLLIEKDNTLTFHQYISLLQDLSHALEKKWTLFKIVLFDLNYVIQSFLTKKECMKKIIDPYLHDIVESISLINQYMSGKSREDLLADIFLQVAIL